MFFANQGYFNRKKQFSKFHHHKNWYLIVFLFYWKTIIHPFCLCISFKYQPKFFVFYYTQNWTVHFRTQVIFIKYAKLINSLVESFLYLRMIWRLENCRFVRSLVYLICFCTFVQTSVAVVRPTHRSTFVFALWPRAIEPSLFHSCLCGSISSQHHLRPEKTIVNYLSFRFIQLYYHFIDKLFLAWAGLHSTLEYNLFNFKLYQPVQRITRQFGSKSNFPNKIFWSFFN